MLSRCVVPGGCQLGLRHPSTGMCTGSTHFRFSCVVFPRCEHINWNVLSDHLHTYSSAMLALEHLKKTKPNVQLYANFRMKLRHFLFLRCWRRPAVRCVKHSVSITTTALTKRPIQGPKCNALIQPVHNHPGQPPKIQFNQQSPEF